MGSQLMKYGLFALIGLMVFNFFTGGVFFRTLRAAKQGENPYQTTSQYSQPRLANQTLVKLTSALRRTQNPALFGTASAFDVLITCFAAAGALFSILGFFTLVIGGFQESVGWGLGALFVPGLGLLYGIIYFDSQVSRIGVYTTLIGIFGMLSGIGLAMI